MVRGRVVVSSLASGALAVPNHARDFFEVPQMFGSGADRVRDGLGRDRSFPDRATAAVHQHRVVQTVYRLLLRQGLKQTSLAVATGISSRRLSQVLTGEPWVHVYDVVSLGRVLGLDLVQVRVIDDLTFDASWAPPRMGIGANSAPERHNVAETEDAAALARARQEYKRARGRRDRAVRAAVNAGVAPTTVAQAPAPRPAASRA